MAHGYRILQHWNDWLNTEMLGRKLLHAEQQMLTSALKKHLGKHVLLIGVPEQHTLLQASNMPVQTIVSSLAGSHPGKYYVETDLHELPILTGSVDLVILPHTLQFIDRSRQLLNEACRIIKPEGLICLLGFNPYSLWGIKKMLNKSKKVPWAGNFIGAHNLKNWLHLADFQIEYHASFLFQPPIQNEQLFNRLHFLDWIGSKFFPPFGGMYVILARAKVIPLTPIKMHWKQQISGIRINTSITGHIAR